MPAAADRCPDQPPDQASNDPTTDPGTHLHSDTSTHLHSDPGAHLHSDSRAAAERCERRLAVAGNDGLPHREQRRRWRQAFCRWLGRGGDRGGHPGHRLDGHCFASAAVQARPINFDPASAVPMVINTAFGGGGLAGMGSTKHRRRSPTLPLAAVPSSVTHNQPPTSRMGEYQAGMGSTKHGRRLTIPTQRAYWRCRQHRCRMYEVPANEPIGGLASTDAGMHEVPVTARKPIGSHANTDAGLYDVVDNAFENQVRRVQGTASPRSGVCNKKTKKNKLGDTA